MGVDIITCQVCRENLHSNYITNLDTLCDGNEDNDFNFFGCDCNWCAVCLKKHYDIEIHNYGKRDKSFFEKFKVLREGEEYGKKYKRVCCRMCDYECDIRKPDREKQHYIIVQILDQFHAYKTNIDNIFVDPHDCIGISYTYQDALKDIEYKKNTVLEFGEEDEYIID